MPFGSEFRSDLNVLFVDDDPAFGALARRRLARRGHKTVLLETGDEVIARVRAGGVDVVTLDHALAGETGLDIMARLGPREARPPIVYVTGDMNARTAVTALKSGADEYVVKDGGDEFFELLIAAIEHVYERWRLKRIRDEQERAVREARDRAEMLLHEVNHRIANSLGLIVAMVRMQANALRDHPAAVQALQETQARITAVGGVHRRLYLHNRIGLVALKDYLEALVDDLRAQLDNRERPHRLVAEVAPVTVTTDKAISLGVMVGELVTNAFKYAYPDGVCGEIRIALEVLGESSSSFSRAVLTVADDGVGFDPGQKAKGTGLGSKILKSLLQNVQGEISYDVSGRGCRACVTFGLDARDLGEDAG
jgi:two-component sensor histidine kinase/CheY-like chemotaxis protein